VDPVSATGVTDGGVEAAAAVGPAPAEVAQPQAASGQVTVTAPMPGIILRYAVEVGQSVQEGDPVVVMEAMKMENTLPAPISGKVASLPLEPGATVVKDDVLATIAP
jgi:biotin carboxyl carrier protein